MKDWQEEIETQKREKWASITIEDHIKLLIEEGLSKKEAIKEVARERKLPKNEVYKFSTEIK